MGKSLARLFALTIMLSNESEFNVWQPCADGFVSSSGLGERVGNFSMQDYHMIENSRASGAPSVVFLAQNDAKITGSDPGFRCVSRPMLSQLCEV